MKNLGILAFFKARLFNVTINVVDKHLIDSNLIVNVDNITAGQPVSVEVSTNETFSGNFKT